jgi:hypothetical protein
MTLAHYTRSPQPKPPSFEPVTMPSAFDALIDLYPPGQTLEHYDRTTRRVACACAALAGVLGAVLWVVLS